VGNTFTWSGPSVGLGAMWADMRVALLRNVSSGIAREQNQDAQLKDVVDMTPEG
jgi:hypothetical protein